MGKKNQILIISLSLLIIGISIAYAGLSTRLNISGQATVLGGGWQIEFDKLSLQEINNIGNLNPTISLTNTTFDLAVELIKPNDSVVYTMDVVNNGDIDAVVKVVTTPDLEAFTAHDVIYNFTYVDGSSIKEGDALNAGDRKTLKLSVSYADVNELDPATIPLDLASSIIYVQA